MHYVPRLVGLLIVCGLVVLVVTGLVSLLSPRSLEGAAGKLPTVTIEPAQQAAQGSDLGPPFVLPPLLPLDPFSQMATALPQLDVQPFTNLFGAATAVAATNTPGSGTTVATRQTATRPPGTAVAATRNAATPGSAPTSVSPAAPTAASSPSAPSGTGPGNLLNRGLGGS